MATEPRKLGNVAANVIDQLNDWNEADVQAFTAIAFAAATGKVDQVIALAEAGAARNMTALKAGILALAGEMAKADAVIMDAKAAEHKKKL